MTGNGAGQAAAGLDPFELWRQFYEVNEQAWTRAVKEMVGSWDYVGAQGKMLDSYLAFQKMMMDGMATQLKSLNIPTRDDVFQLGDLVVGVEEKVDQVDGQVTSVVDRLAGVEGKLDQLDHRLGVLADRFTSVEAKVTQLEPRLAGLGEGLAGVEGKLAQLDYRLAAVEERLVGLEKRQEKRIEELDRRLQDLDRRLSSRPRGGEPAGQGEAGSETAPKPPAQTRAASRRAPRAEKAQ